MVEVLREKEKKKKKKKKKSTVLRQSQNFLVASLFFSFFSFFFIATMSARTLSLRCNAAKGKTAAKKQAPKSAGAAKPSLSKWYGE